MPANIQSVMHTLVYSPVQRVTQSVRHYSSQLARWVQSCRPMHLLNTPVNRAIMNARYERGCMVNGRFLAAMKFSPDLQSSQASGKLHLVTDDSRYIERTGFQYRVDRLCSPLLKMFLPAQEKSDPPGSPSESLDEVIFSEDDKRLDPFALEQGWEIVDLIARNNRA